MSNMYDLSFFSQESLENLANANLAHLESFACDETHGFRPQNLRVLLDPGRQSGVLGFLSISSTGLDMAELQELLYEGYFATVSDLSMAALALEDDFIDCLVQEMPKLES